MLRVSSRWRLLGISATSRWLLGVSTGWWLLGVPASWWLLRIAGGWGLLRIASRGRVTTHRSTIALLRWLRGVASGRSFRKRKARLGKQCRKLTEYKKNKKIDNEKLTTSK